MKAKINVSITGVRGGDTKVHPNKGDVCVYVDENKSDFASSIFVDAFEGAGANYKRRETSLIRVRFGGAVWHGTIEQLMQKLNS